MFIVTQMVHKAGARPATSGPRYNSWGGTIVGVTDKAFTLPAAGHLSQGDSKETSLGTNGGAEISNPAKGCTPVLKSAARLRA